MNCFDFFLFVDFYVLLYVSQIIIVPPPPLSKFPTVHSTCGLWWARATDLQVTNAPPYITTEGVLNFCINFVIVIKEIEIFFFFREISKWFCVRVYKGKRRELKEVY